MGGEINWKDIEKQILNKAMKKIPNISYDAFEIVDESDCGKPRCPVPKRPRPDFRCTCNQPIMIYIPPGGHIHLTCPVHGDRIVYGPDITWCESEKSIWKYDGPSPTITWDEELSWHRYCHPKI